MYVPRSIFESTFLLHPPQALSHLFKDLWPSPQALFINFSSVPTRFPISQPQPTPTTTTVYRQCTPHPATPRTSPFSSTLSSSPQQHSPTASLQQHHNPTTSDVVSVAMRIEGYGRITYSDLVPYIDCMVDELGDTKFMW